MHIFGLGLFLLIAAFWIFHGLQTAYGARRLPRMKNVLPASDQECPSVSLLFAARDEEAKLPAALETVAALDYPSLEVVAVDDRSADATAKILDEVAAKKARFCVVHVEELPSGWLGKPHALEKAYEASAGEWLLFTDADVKFEKSVLRRAIRLARREQLDHLTLITNVEMHGFWETVALTFFGLAFFLGNAPHQASNPRSGAYMGVGAFQMLKRSVYEQIGTHRKLAMEVVDDMKIGKLVKRAGFRSGVAISEELVSLRWHAGLKNVIRGVTKNFFAAFGYRLEFAIAGFFGMLLVNVAPFVGIFVTHGWTRALCAVSIAIALAMHAGADIFNGVSPLYALTLPIGTVLFCYMIARSVVATLWHGGVTWRGTFYPLEQLKKGVV